MRLKELREAVDPWKRYEKLEDDNRHGENIIHLAKHVGTKDDLKLAKELHAQHMKDGHASGIMHGRMELNNKLWPKFHDKFAPKD